MIIQQLQMLKDYTCLYNFKNLRMKVKFTTMEQVWTRIHGIKIGNWFIGFIKTE